MTEQKFLKQVCIPVFETTFASVHFLFNPFWGNDLMICFVKDWAEERQIKAETSLVRCLFLWAKTPLQIACVSK